MKLVNCLAIFCEKTARLRHMIPLELFILLSSGMRVNNEKCNLGFQEIHLYCLISSSAVCTFQSSMIRRTFHILCNGPRYQSEQYVKPTVSSTVTPSRRRRTLSRARTSSFLRVWRKSSCIVFNINASSLIQFFPCNPSNFHSGMLFPLVIVYTIVDAGLNV